MFGQSCVSAPHAASVSALALKICSQLSTKKLPLASDFKQF